MADQQDINIEYVDDPEEEREHDRAAERQVGPEPEPPQPEAERAVADEQEVAGDEKGGEDGIHQAVERRPQRGLVGQDVEDGRDDADDEHDHHEPPQVNPRAGASHGVSGCRRA